ncbi:MAG: tRNA (N(6)-L-threonylcarbamoyladenosine(37)-C(2))-methylthiotransferase MtaB [Eubacteriales bacterium]|nr:tRNA (N(6)-L-threonylcarbamoyladenosine(37)-C(2))-methylthiotransferase MtaB [Clostridiales bacterium]MDY5835966.1 tRNA (N(6)-L-threonylcarbamoyladenosine(37)-C(2))-methylthiotransferase MtaB [Eubacteriales bacterium]
MKNPDREQKSFSYCLHSFGCKSNAYESEAIGQFYAGQGGREVQTNAQADIIVFNTCTVTAEAGRKARQALRRARKEAPEACLVVMGCYSQLEADEGLADFWAGTDGRLALAQEALASYKANQGLGSPARNIGQASQAGPQKAQAYEELGQLAQQKETRAQIKIADGCNQHCTYCAIRLARGPLRSRDREDILAEARQLLAAGHRELVLTATNITAFEADKGRDSLALAELLAALADLPGLGRLRLGSLEPQAISQDLVAALGKNPKLCPHFHISLQSGSDKILKLMGRGHSQADYRAIVEALRQHFPNPAITTDIMVGFPGESEEDFQASYDFAREIAFARIHIFRYSPRPHTPAARLPQLEEAVKKDRADRLEALAQELAASNAAKYLGREVEVILEQPLGPESLVQAQKGEDSLAFSGYTAHYLPAQVFFSKQDSGSQGQQGQLWWAQVEDLAGELLICRPLDLIGSPLPA